MNTKKVMVVLAALFSISMMEARLVFTTINNPGFYQLSDELNNSVTIEVSDVTFDLNGHTITAATGIIINGGLDAITIMNGNIQATTDGIIANPGCSGITLENMRVEGAICGINFDNVTSGLISNCEMTMNTTGLLLDNSHKITVKDCIANCNVKAGYDLLSSTTNCFDNCKALSTGQGNNALYGNNVFGFVSADGYGNIFERCIANSTQALSTTDSNSLIAGFALRGSEGCTKIIDSESANSQTNVNGFTVPYGILLEGTLDFTQNVTGIIGTGNVLQVDWSPDGKYVVVVGALVAHEEIGDDFVSTLVQIYAFDRVRGEFESLSRALVTSGSASAVAWSPSGEYLAVSFVSELFIYSFDKVNRKLKIIAQVDFISGEVRDISWFFDERYIAIAAENAMVVYAFDRVTYDLVLALDAFTDPNSVSFSPDGRFLAVGTAANGSGNQLQVIGFNPVIGEPVLPLIGTFDGFSNVKKVRWSPDGHYLAVGGINLTGGTNDEVQIFKHDRNAASLISIAGDLSTTGTVFDVEWSPDGKYIAAGGWELGGGREIFQIFEFDRAAGTLAGVDTALGTNGAIVSVKWSPDGGYIAVGGAVNSPGDRLQIFQGIQFPEKNVIKGNTVYCNSGNQFPNGVGISGSSICNMIIENAAFNNPLATQKNKPIVGSNYQFVANIFNQYFGDAPSDTQNISLDGCGPTVTPSDIPLLLRQILYKEGLMLTQLDSIESKIDANDDSSQLDVIESKEDVIANTVNFIESKVCVMDSQLDTIESKVDAMDSQLDTIESKVDALETCGLISLSSADVSGGMITLSTAGNYCLAENITADIIISESHITLDLNQRALTGTITINTSRLNIIIRNGYINSPLPIASPSPAITQGSFGNVLIENIVIVCDGAGASNVQGRDGIQVVERGIVKNCVITAGNAIGGNTIATRGGHGIITGGQCFIDGCIIKTGSGGGLTEASGTAGNGGSGIVAQDANQTTITNCQITTNNGGSCAIASSTGGNGGAGISVEGTSTNINITDCTIIATGNGGNAAVTGGIGGNGGDGIMIASTTSDVAVRRCTIHNTGTGGTGTATSGAPGKAIDDDVTTPGSLSQIFANFAHNIANSTKFDLQAAGEAGILTPNPPTAAVINPLANVYSS